MRKTVFVSAKTAAGAGFEAEFLEKLAADLSWRVGFGLK